MACNYNDLLYFVWFWPLIVKTDKHFYYCDLFTYFHFFYFIFSVPIPFSLFFNFSISFSILIKPLSSTVKNFCIPIYGASLVAQRVKHLPTTWETWVQSLGREDPLEEEMAIHSSTLTWKIPWTERLGRLQSTGSQYVYIVENF